MGTPKNAIIELFSLSVPAKWGGGEIRWTNDLNEHGTSMVFDGVSYTRMAIEAEGFDMDGERVPRPRLRVGNADGLVGYQASLMGNFANCKVTRTRVFAMHMDAANFLTGNPEADPDAAFRPDVFYIDRKVAESREMVEFELRPATDLRQAKLPGGIITQNSCRWHDVTDCQFALTCGKTLANCQTNWASTAHLGLPFGGFPACGLGTY